MTSLLGPTCLGLAYSKTLRDPVANTVIDFVIEPEAMWVKAHSDIHEWWEENGRPEAGSAKNLADLSLFLVACFRRTRGLVAMRAIFGPLVNDDPKKADLGPYATVDDLLTVFAKVGYFVPLEGGMSWMKRPIRDRIYTQITIATTTEMTCQFFCTRPRVLTDKIKETTRTLVQLVVLALHHDRIARHYHSETFSPSQDVSAFFEYTYHRVSSIR